MLTKLHDLKTHRNPEEGLTLLELVVVVIIIGIIAAVAVPIFANQQKAAAEATVKTDLKKAALAMQTSASLTNGMYPSEIPADYKASNGNTITLSDREGNVYGDPNFANGNVGWVSVSPSTSTPPSGNAVLLNRRDHRMTTDSITVRPGDSVEITATVRRVVGTNSLQAGVWKSTGMPAGCGPYLTYPTLTNKTVIATYPDGWVRYRNIITVPTSYKSGTNQVCSNTVMPAQFQVSPFFQISQGLEAQDPYGTTQWEISDVTYRNISEISRTTPGAINLVTGKRLGFGYCIEGRSSADPTNVWRISSGEGVPVQGTCI